MIKRFIFLLFITNGLHALATDGKNLATIHNFHRITETIGTAGQPTRTQFEDVKNADFAVVVNLAMHDSTNALADEADIVTALNMAYVHIPVLWQAPSLADVKEFFAVMDAAERNGDNVFVHCAANYRASAFTYKYLTLRKGVSSEESMSPLLRRWLPEMDDNWRSIMALTINEID